MDRRLCVTAGDGVYLIALAWHAYTLSHTPTALAMLGVAATVPQLLALLGSGILSDRVERRRVLLGADAIRFVALLADALAGVRFVKSRTWLWGALVSATVAYLLFMGPTEVLLPYLVKEVLHGTASDLGAILDAGGVGAIAATVIVGKVGLPRRQLDLPVPLLDRSRPGGARLWAVHRRMAAHDHLPGHQRSRGLRDGCLGHHQAGTRSRRDAWTGIKPGHHLQRAK